MIPLDERSRRRPGADGTPALLADGCRWLLAHPTYRPAVGSLTTPEVDRPLDRLFEGLVLGESVEMADVWEAARGLLLRNYELSDEELSFLLEVGGEAEAAALAEAVSNSLLGGDPAERTFSRWVRSTLLANGLAGVDLGARDLADVLAILTATGRTIPLTRFADACRRLDERSRLESLV